MTANSDWLARYNARKHGQQAPPQPPVYSPPPPQYGAPPPPPQGYQPGYSPPVAPPTPVYQPVPGAPPHAPFGYDPTSGVPIAPYGRDGNGQIIVQQYYQQPQPQQYVQPPAHDPRGQVMPQGYGQPPYGPAGYPQQPAYQPPVEVDPNTGQPVVHAMDAAAAYKGGKGQRATPCPECDGYMTPTDATGEARVLNTRTGEFAYPAAHCNKCGYNGAVRPGESVGALAGMAGGGIQIVGQPRLAPGAGSLQQTAGQHGMPNLFAPKAG